MTRSPAPSAAASNAPAARTEPGARAARFAADVLAVIVLYGRTLADAPTFRSLDAALAHGGARLSLLVYDNSADASPLPDLDRRRWDVHAVHDPSNPGVSAAYRAGARLAASLGKRWLLCLDQDTEIPAGALDAYAGAVEGHPDEVLFAPVLVAGGAVVSPCAYRALRGRSIPPLPPGVHALDGRSVLNSGMCVRLSAYEEAGGHDAAIPLDFSDHELVARLRRRHPRFVVVGTTLGHGLSATEPTSSDGARRRFVAYRRGAARLGGGALARLGVRLHVAARGALLAARWRDPGFLVAAVRDPGGASHD